jgi:hypothetical protein
MIFSFDSQVAQKYGVTEAILYEFFSRILVKNMVDDVNHEDGTFWTVASYTALSAVMPFYTERQIRYAMANMMKEGIILQLKKKHRNRTSWWGMPIEALKKLHVTEMSNGIAPVVTKVSPKPKENVVPININNNPPISPHVASIDLNALVDVFAKDRKDRGSKMTPLSKKMLINKLQKFQADGHDPESMVNTAIEHGWKTVYEPQQRQQFQAKSQQRPKYIRQGLNPDIIEEDAYEQFRKEQGSGNSNDQPPRNSLPNTSNGSST